MCDLHVQGVENLWWERGTPEAIGICLLDTMSDAQVIYSLEHNDRARDDLPKITTDTHLLELAKTVKRLPDLEYVDMQQKDQNRPHEVTAIPFYAIFRGQPPTAQ